MAVFQATLNRNRKAGYAIGLGAILAEAIYCSIPLFGVGQIDPHHWIFDVLFPIVILVLAYLGFRSLMAPIPESTAHLKDSNKSSQLQKIGYWGLIGYGFALCLSNPMTFVMWIKGALMVRKTGIVTDAWWSLWAFFLGVPVGTWVLYACFALLAYFTKRRISAKLHQRINAFIGIAFVLLAVLLLLHWLASHGVFESLNNLPTNRT